MPKKYLIIAKARGTTDGFVPADYLSDTKMAAVDDIKKFHMAGLNGEPEWPIHSVAEVRIGISEAEMMEAGACLWEAMMDWKTAGLSDDITHWWEANGAGAVRMTIIGFAEECHEAWVLAHRDVDAYDYGFDWEFVPWFLAECLDWSEHGPGLKSDWRELATQLGEK